MSGKYTSTVAGASLVIIFFGLISKGLGFIREIVFAASFGLSKNFDIYLAGSVIPVIINTGIIYLAQNFFIPSYNKLKSDNGDTGIFFNTFLLLFASGGLIISVLLYIEASNIISLYLSNSSASTQAEASDIFKIFILTIPINSAIALISAFLQAEFEFRAPAVSQLWVNVSIIILTLIFYNKLNVLIIPVGYLTGTMFQFLYLLPKVKKYIKFILPQYSKIKALVSVTFSTLIITIFIEIISQLYLFADRFFIRSVDTGGIAALNYAQNLYMLPVAVFSIALSTAIFPKLSLKYHSGDEKELNRNIISGLNINTFISLPLTVLFGMFGIYVIRLFYQNGNFTESDSITTFGVLQILSISLLFYSSYSILNKLIYGIGALKFLFAVTIIGISLKFVLNYILVEYLKQNGLALSSSITYIYFFVVSILFAKFKLKLLELKSFAKEILMTMMNCATAYLLTIILKNSFGATGFTGAAGLILVFLVLYTGNALLLRQSSIEIIKSAGSAYIRSS